MALLGQRYLEDAHAKSLRARSSINVFEHVREVNRESEYGEVLVNDESIQRYTEDKRMTQLNLGSWRIDAKKRCKDNRLFEI